MQVGDRDDLDEILEELEDVYVHLNKSLIARDVEESMTGLFQLSQIMGALRAWSGNPTTPEESLQ